MLIVYEAVTNHPQERPERPRVPSTSGRGPDRSTLQRCPRQRPNPSWTAKTSKYPVDDYWLVVCFNPSEKYEMMMMMMMMMIIDYYHYYQWIDWYRLDGSQINIDQWIESLANSSDTHMQLASQFCVHSNSLSLRISRSEQSPVRLKQNSWNTVERHQIFLDDLAGKANLIGSSAHNCAYSTHDSSIFIMCSCKIRQSACKEKS